MPVQTPFLYPFLEATPDVWNYADMFAAIEPNLPQLFIPKDEPNENMENCQSNLVERNLWFSQAKAEKWKSLNTWRGNFWKLYVMSFKKLAIILDEFFCTNQLALSVHLIDLHVYKMYPFLVLFILQSCSLRMMILLQYGYDDTTLIWVWWYYSNMNWRKNGWCVHW